jgi:hypothetical protein
MHEEFMGDDFTSADFKGSLVIFDDLGVFPSKIKKESYGYCE